MDDLRALDVTDEAAFGRMPRCADPGFDHRSCDYWEDDRHGSKAARLDWLTPTAAPVESPAASRPSTNPFVADVPATAANPFARAGDSTG